MGFLNQRNALMLIIMAFLAVMIARLAGPGEDDTLAGQGGTSPAERTESGGLEDLDVSAYLFLGGLQDEPEQARPLAEDELGSLLEKAFEPAPKSRPAGVVRGEDFYSGIGPVLNWAGKYQVRGPVGAYMPEPLPAHWFTGLRQFSRNLLQNADEAAAYLEPDSDIAQLLYSSLLLDLNLLALALPEDPTVLAQRAHALNGVARSLPLDRSGAAYRLAADLAGQAGQEALGELGLAQLGLALAEDPVSRLQGLAEAEENLLKELDVRPDGPRYLYALAVIAGQRGESSQAEGLLRKTAEQDNAVTSLYMSSDPYLANLRGQPWFLEVAALFPGERNLSTFPEETESWLEHEVSAAEPTAGGPEGARLVLWAKNISSAGILENDSLRRNILLHEIDRLLLRARALADPPLSAEDYQFWGSSFLHAGGGCASGDLEWIRKSVAAFRASLELDPGLLRSGTEMLGAYGQLILCADDSEREALYEESTAALALVRPENLSGALHFYDAYAVHWARWGLQGEGPERDRRIAEGVRILERVAGQLADDPQYAPYALYGVANFKQSVAGTVHSPLYRQRLLNEAEEEAERWLSGLDATGGPYSHRRAAGFLLRDLALNYEADDPAKSRRFAERALEYFASQDGGLEDIDNLALIGMAGSLRCLGLAETDPEKKREAFFVGASLALAGLINGSENLGHWNTWALLLCNLSEVALPGDREVLLDTARRIFLFSDAIQPGSESYNMGCIEALAGHPEQARRWLERARDLNTLPSRQHMDKDPDMDSLRELPWFKDLLPER